MSGLCSLVNTEVRSKISEINNRHFCFTVSRKMSMKIFTLCHYGNEEGVRRMISADRAVFFARDTVSCPLPKHRMSHIYLIIHVDPHHISHLYCIQRNFTPLHHAAANGHTAIVQLLLNAGADKNTKNDVSAY